MQQPAFWAALPMAPAAAQAGSGFPGKVMAYKKLALVSLLYSGEVVQLPKYVPNVTFARAITRLAHFKWSPSSKQIFATFSGKILRNFSRFF